METQKVFAAQESDYDDIIEVWEASVRETHTFLEEAYILHMKPLIRNEYLKLVDLYKYQPEEKILGFVGILHGKIEMLFIRPDKRRMGIGKELLDFAISQLKATEVDVNEQNEHAVNFYRKFGFNIKSRSEFDSLGKPYPILHLSL